MVSKSSYFPLFSVCFFCLPLFSWGAENKAPARKEVSWEKQSGLYAVFNTNHGTIVCRLFEKQAPKAVANFIELVEGKREWADPKTGQKKKSRFYDGLIFHRVIPNFMIQGGDPLGNGMGGPGYRFEDEFSKDSLFDKPGKLAMANAGPNTNGSQFFITVAPTPWLNSRHTIFGEIVGGQNVVDKISQVAKDSADKPLQPVTIKKLVIQKIK